MLTHKQGLHEVNLGWHPRAEDVLWQPEIKRSRNGALNVRYALETEQRALTELRGLLADHTPWLRVRYAF